MIHEEVPISCTNQEDIQIWRGTKNGVFSMKSAYYLQKGGNLSFYGWRFITWGG
jgi:hypothetical protein